MCSWELSSLCCERALRELGRRLQTNRAFVFIKPHAVNDKVKALVKEHFQKHNITIIAEGTISSEEIDAKKLIDNHYYAIASKATILKPRELNVPEEVFAHKFGLEWHAALESGKVYNALDACAFLGISAVEMDKQWGITKKADKLVKFGGGFYCGLVEVAGKDPIYVFNGFFMEMRAKYTTPGLSIHYYSVEWDADTLSWADFRGSVLGPTDPAEGPRDSARGQIYEKWESLGLEGQPNVGDNGVHASASPFEALAERCNWLGADFATDPYGAELVAAGVPVATLKAWSVDPQVKRKSLFDQLEDLNVSDCTTRAVELYTYENPTE